LTSRFDDTTIASLNDYVKYPRAAYWKREGKKMVRGSVISGVCAAVAALVSSESIAARAQESMKALPSTAEDEARTSLHQEVPLEAGSGRIYDILMDSKQFASFTGLPATIDPTVGGGFSLFEGMIVGRNVELDRGQLIVQAWRPTHWDPGSYSIVRFVLKPAGSGSVVVLDHSGFPPGEFDHLSAGWKEHYWEPLTKYVARAAL
jgi:activator of HSP90 ATPase